MSGAILLFGWFDGAVASTTESNVITQGYGAFTEDLVIIQGYGAGQPDNRICVAISASLLNGLLLSESLQNGVALSHSLQNGVALSESVYI